MKLIRNTVGSFLTGSAIADAVMTLNLALSRRCEVDIVDIPIVDDQGVESRVQLTVGWHVGLVTQEHSSEMAELLEPETTRSFTKRASPTGDPVGLPFTLEEVNDMAWEDDGSLVA
jgi:hypothetical protein